MALSAYLCLDTPLRREWAYQEFCAQMHERLEDCGQDAECREAIREDMEIVGLYLRTNGHRQHNALAIFSCAAELFWLAYPLAVPIPTQITIGSRFNVAPLLQPDASTNAP